MDRQKNKQSKMIVAMVTGLMLHFSPLTLVHAEEAFTIKSGELQRPTGYREWIYVGTPVTPNDMNNGKAAFPEHHNVYIDPKSWRHWKKTGEFRDGTILVKELISVGSKAAVSGKGYFQGEFIGLEATIKSKTNFPKEPGNWAYFSFSSKDHKSLAETAEPFPAASCNACHQKSAADDFVFTQYYPVLSSGKAMGEKATGGYDFPAQHVETFRATATGEGWSTEVAISDTEWTLKLDEPKEDGGSGSAPNPMHYFTASLAGCQSEQAQVVAKELGIKASRIDMTIAVMLNLDGFMGVTNHSQGAFQQVDLTAVVHGVMNEDEVLALGKGVDARCPILELLRASGCTIKSSWKKAN